METERRFIETKEEVEAYLAKLNYSLDNPSTRIRLQKMRVCDSERDFRYSNEYAFDTLFPDEREDIVFRRELKKLTIDDYIETVEDKGRKNFDYFRVFAKEYQLGDVYIKIRVDLVINGGQAHIMSFHFAEWEIKESDYPYRQGEQG